MLPPGTLFRRRPEHQRDPARNNMLEDMLMATGFASADPAAITQPVLVITGVRSNSQR